MNVVVCNMSNVQDWRQGIVNRNFFVLRELLRSGMFKRALLVDFLSVNPVGLVFGKRRTVRYAYDALIQQGSLPIMRRFGVLHALRSFPATGWGSNTESFVLSGVGTRHSYSRDIHRIQEAIESIGFDSHETVLWSYNTFAPELLDIPVASRVFDAVDDWSQHASYGQFRDRLKANYVQIGMKADCVFTVSDGLRSLFPSGKAHWVPNGVDLDAFKDSPAVPEEMSSLPKPVIGYVGTVQERLDFSMIQYVCQQWPRASFVFIGPVWGGVQGQVDALCQQCPNIRFLGRREYQLVPGYLRGMDVAIIPHRLDAFISSTNPMKLYDYLAAGKPVVSTPGAGTELFERIVHLATTPADFSQAIKKALAETGADKQKERQQAVMPYTWKARVDMMREALQHGIVKGK